jgi:glycosyltransferase involved in cell wall biosynthesis
MIRVAFDSTPLRLSGGGVATYARELQTAFAARDDVEVLDVHHVRTGAGSTAARITAGIDREARFYPRNLARQARAIGADLIHVPAAMKADLILTDSHASKDDIVNLLLVDASRVEVIHLGISPAFSPANRDRHWVEQRYGLNGPIVLSVGTPEPRKNLRGTIEIFERVAKEFPEASLILVGGDGWGTDPISERIAASPCRIIRTGRVDFDDLTHLYASADCFLFPSLLEGFGFPPLEAMASGTPVVCSDRPSLPEVVGDAALTAAPDDIEALVRCVTQVLGDSAVAATLRERGLAQSASFSWARTADQTVAAYRRVLA